MLWRVIVERGRVIPDATEIARKTWFTDDLTAVIYLGLRCSG